MSTVELEELRDRLEDLDETLIELLNKREALLQKQNLLSRDEYEKSLRKNMAVRNKGPMQTESLIAIFDEIKKTAQDKQKAKERPALLVSRSRQPENTLISIKGEIIGGSIPHLIAGPCAVESLDQVHQTAKEIKTQGLAFMRGGAFKPRTSPYDFQGLGLEGLKLLKQAGDQHGLAVISEIVDPRDLEMAVEYLDIVQIGARNMQNFELLKEAGKIKKPILLKRGMSATINEFIHAAEYIVVHGNRHVILCERGIRTYEKATRNTLDITAVPILKQETHLPVFVDVTHSTGRKDLLLPAAKAALAIGADGVMAEVHPNPATALSDSAQQMDFEEFQIFMQGLIQSGLYKAEHIYA